MQHSVVRVGKAWQGLRCYRLSVYLGRWSRDTPYFRGFPVACCTR
jgi:hypothetical protein